MNSKKPLLGAHVSIAGGLPKAIDRGKALGCTAIQVFTKNATQWKSKPVKPDEVSLFRRSQKESGLLIVAHDSYLINLGSPNELLARKSERALVEEIERAAMFGITIMVIHPGSHTGSGVKAGIHNVIVGLNRVLKNTRGSDVLIALENTAGQGSSLGHEFEHLAEIINQSDHPERLAVCLDTCHAFAAGYDLRTQAGCRETVDELNYLVGQDRIAVIHLNDSKRGIGSRVDRHEHIGRGSIGSECFRFFMNCREFREKPKIIETPKTCEGIEMDCENLSILCSYVS